MKIKVRCECCNEMYELEVQNACSKSCAAITRERRLARRRHPKPLLSAKEFLHISQPSSGR